MCSGDQRNDVKKDGAATNRALNLMYFGYASVSVRGPFTGQLYQFSRLHPVQSVDARDAVTILRTRLFRQIR